MLLIWITPNGDEGEFVDIRPWGRAANSTLAATSGTER